MTSEQKDIAATLRDTACCWRGDDPIAIELRQAADEIERLRAELVSKADELEATLRELRKVEAERDEARRENCRMAVDLYVDESLEDETLEDAAMILAERKGWDCFKENKR